MIGVAKGLMIGVAKGLELGLMIPFLVSLEFCLSISFFWWKDIYKASCWPFARDWSREFDDLTVKQDKALEGIQFLSSCISSSHFGRKPLALYPPTVLHMLYLWVAVISLAKPHLHPPDLFGSLVTWIIFLISRTSVCCYGSRIVLDSML